MTSLRLQAGSLALLAASCAQIPEAAPPAGYAASVTRDVVEPASLDRVERITTAVPWPRGVRMIDGKLYALGRGVHRSAGGPQDDIEDRAGTLFEIDPAVFEPAVPEAPVGTAVRANASILAEPTGPPFRLWDRRMPATEDTLTDRPYCMLVWDEPSRNFFVCGYSGIDLPGGPIFRKNATDSIHRYDLRTSRWYAVEAHDPSVVPVAELGVDVDSRYYPHHDVELNPPPHGLVNGPCGAVVAGRYLYVGAKDNSALARYDLDEIRADAEAPPPHGEYVFEGSHGSAHVEIEGHGAMEINGTCALAVHEGWLYVSFRTTSQLLRFPLEEDGSLVQPLVGQYIAQFSTYDDERGGGSANIYDLAFDSAGRCYVSPGYDGAVYRFTPDPARVLDFRTGDYTPYVDLEALVGAEKSGNICLDADDNLYICSGQAMLPDSRLRGVIYRVRPEGA